MTTRVTRQKSVWRVFGRWESEITRDTLKGGFQRSVRRAVGFEGGVIGAVGVDIVYGASWIS